MKRENLLQAHSINERLLFNESVKSALITVAEFVNHEHYDKQLLIKWLDNAISRYQKEIDRLNEQMKKL